MSLQSAILNDLKNSLGPLTLTDVALMTGINITRIFRIMHGQKMRLDEYEKFLAALSFKKKSKGEKTEKNFESIYSMISKLNNKKTEEVLKFVEHKYYLQQFTA